jgi:hypothetical protein
LASVSHHHHHHHHHYHQITKLSHSINTMASVSVLLLTPAG